MKVVRSLVKLILINLINLSFTFSYSKYKHLLDCLNGPLNINCEMSSNSHCRYDEYACSDNNQCIPQDYLCDSIKDCLDSSDEIGCSGPTIVEQPNENLIVQEDDNLTLTCRALGKPIPTINWMYNGTKLTPNLRFAWTTGQGVGILIVRKIRLNESGIWSCYAENTRNIISGRGSIVSVKARGGVCFPPFFNDKAINQSECLRCHCFGITNRCFSSNLKVIHIPLVKDVNLVVLKVIGSEPFTDVSDLYPHEPIVFNKHNNEFKISHQAFGVNNLEDALFYWSLSSAFLGNQLNSYGGYLRYSYRYRSPFTPRDPEIFDVIISGNGLTLFHRLKTNYPRGGEEIQVEARFWEGLWSKNERNLHVNYSLNQIASREEILKVLANLDRIYIRASYDEVFLDSSLIHLRMDSAAHRDLSNLQDAYFVEKCACPEGYDGNSCEYCELPYIRQRDDLYLGKCVKPNLPCLCNGHSDKCDGLTQKCIDCKHNTEGFHCDRCIRGFYGNPINGKADDCQPCPCPYIKPSNQLSNLWIAGFPPQWFSPTCFLDIDNDVTCSSCPLGFEGRRCERCAPGYEGDLSLPDSSCNPKGLIAKFNQNPSSYIILPAIENAYIEFEIEISIFPNRVDDGLILYQGKYSRRGDFISLGFLAGYLEFKLELGSGVTVVKSGQILDPGQWYTVKIVRQKRNVEMDINSEIKIKASSKGKFVGLDLKDEPLYVGSLPAFNNVQDPLGHRQGFYGCIGPLKIQGIKQNLMTLSDEQKINVDQCDKSLTESIM